MQNKCSIVSLWKHVHQLLQTRDTNSGLWFSIQIGLIEIEARPVLLAKLPRSKGIIRTSRNFLFSRNLLCYHYEEKWPKSFRHCNRQQPSSCKILVINHLIINVSCWKLIKNIVSHRLLRQDYIHNYPQRLVI